MHTANFDKTNSLSYYAELPKDSNNCPICTSEKLTLVHDNDRYCMGIKTMQCQNCGFIYQNPAPTLAAMENFYAYDYRIFYENTEIPNEDYLKNSVHSSRAEQIVQTLLKCNNSTDELSILDLGSAEGTLLERLSNAFPRSSLHGVEPSENFCKYSKSRLADRASILNGTLQNMVDSDFVQKGTIDVIILSHVLEHFHDPISVLKTLLEYGKQGVIIYVEVPNLTSKYGSSGQFHIAHLNYFTPRTLNNAFRAAGLTTIFGIEYEGLTDKWAMSAIACRSKQSQKLNTSKIRNSLEYYFIRYKLNKFNYLSRRLLRPLFFALRGFINRV